MKSKFRFDVLRAIVIGFDAACSNVSPKAFLEMKPLCRLRDGARPDPAMRRFGSKASQLKTSLSLMTHTLSLQYLRTGRDSNFAPTSVRFDHRALLVSL